VAAVAVLIKGLVELVEQVVAEMALELILMGMQEQQTLVVEAAVEAFRHQAH
jgi:hypothetical protein